MRRLLLIGVLVVSASGLCLCQDAESFPGTTPLDWTDEDFSVRIMDGAHAFVEAAFRDGAVHPTGTAITKILPPVSRFAMAGGHSAKKRTVLQKLRDFFDPFFGLT